MCIVLPVLPALGAAVRCHAPFWHAIDRLRASERPGTLVQCNMAELNLTFMRRHQIRQCAYTVRLRPFPSHLLGRPPLSHAALSFKYDCHSHPSFAIFLVSLHITIQAIV